MIPFCYHIYTVICKYTNNYQTYSFILCKSPSEKSYRFFQFSILCPVLLRYLQISQPCHMKSGNPVNRTISKLLPFLFACLNIFSTVTGLHKNMRINLKDIVFYIDQLFRNSCLLASLVYKFHNTVDWTLFSMTPFDSLYPKHTHCQ